LAGWYEYLSVGRRENGFPYRLNQRTSDLAVEARRTVVELRPEWGDAYFWLANILWYTNPKVEAFWDGSSDTLGSIQSNDPSVQEVLHELDLAWSYGLSENITWEEGYLVEMMNRTVPGLDLALPGAPTATVTIIPSTETLAPTATNTSSPIASPTIVPSVSPTPISTETPSTSYSNVLLIVALGLIVAGGIFVFRLKSK
jgi:hypothetical protein